MLIIFAGLPGVGKTTLSKVLAERIGATYLRIDSIEGAMAASTLNIHPAEDAGYLVGYAVAEDNLRLGRTVVADSVNSIDLTRTAWLAVATRAQSDAVEIEIVCSDQDEHRRRLEQRNERAEGQRSVSWEDVVDREYHPWTRERLVIDTAKRTVNEGVEGILAKLSTVRA